MLRACCITVLALLPGAAGFLPAVQHLQAVRASAPADTRAAAIVMGRKGRPKMPQGMGGSMASGMQQQAPSAPSDGQSVFYLYCRSGPSKPWYPVSAMKGGELHTHVDCTSLRGPSPHSTPSRFRAVVFSCAQMHSPRG